MIDEKGVIGPKKDIEEVVNAMAIYDALDTFDPHSTKSFLNAYQRLMKGLIKNVGQFRTQGVRIVKGEKVQHLAPPFSSVPGLIKGLFDYLKHPDELCLIKVVCSIMKWNLCPHF